MLRADEHLEPFGLTTRQWLLLAVLDKQFPGAAPSISEATAVLDVSLGCALENVHLAARARGVQPEVVLVPGGPRWHPADGPSFASLEFHVDCISYLEPGDPGRDGLDAREVVGSR